MTRTATLRFVKFCTVGALGVGVNIGVFWLLHSRLHVQDLVANPIAIEVSIIGNFLLNDSWTWRDRRRPGAKAFAGRFVRYNTATCAVAALTDMLVLWAFTRYLQMDTYLAKGLGIGIGTILNFSIHHLWTFKKQKGLT